LISSVFCVLQSRHIFVTVWNWLEFGKTDFFSLSLEAQTFYGKIQTVRNVINNDVFLHVFSCFSLRLDLWLQVCTVCYSVNSLDLAGEFKMQLEWKKLSARRWLSIMARDCNRFCKIMVCFLSYTCFSACVWKTYTSHILNYDVRIFADILFDWSQKLTDRASATFLGMLSTRRRER
jgi:hypothetical protein